MGAIGKNSNAGATTSSGSYKNFGGNKAVRYSLLDLKDTLEKILNSPFNSGSDVTEQRYAETNKLLNSEEIPKESSGYTADVVWRVAPIGSVMEVKNANNPSDNGLWIVGRNNYDNKRVYTHIETADGQSIQDLIKSNSYDGPLFRRDTSGFDKIRKDNTTLRFKTFKV